LPTWERDGKSERVDAGVEGGNGRLFALLAVITEPICVVVA